MELRRDRDRRDGRHRVGSGGTSACKVAEAASDAVPPCTKKAPPDSFDPVVQWSWTAPDGTYPYSGSYIMPLVGNFTDDNGDGAVDLCDVPDVIVTTLPINQGDTGGRMYLLAGDTGAQELEFAEMVDSMITPAFGDIDGDGLPEVVAVTIVLTDGGTKAERRLIAFENDGSVKWHGDVTAEASGSYCTAVALYDLDGDGSVEIISAFEVYDKDGHRLWGVPGNEVDDLGPTFWCPTATAADLDGDGMLEVIFDRGAYHADGTLYWEVPGPPAQPHVANLDDDPEPEVVFTTKDGFTVLEHDGKVKVGPFSPPGAMNIPNCLNKPGVIHDFDGDGKADVALGSCTDFTVYDPKALSPHWSAAVQDSTGLATGTAFDFFGDGVADAIYADETKVFVFDGATGAIEMTAPRPSSTIIEYPVVADVDNDGSAEIVIAANNDFGGPKPPAIIVLRDSQDRWVQARRVWNQHAYHVTNVREDGTIPAHMKNSWQLLNTFRTNAQIEGAGDCNPESPK